jgi:hypothetical protein
VTTANNQATIDHHDQEEQRRAAWEARQWQTSAKGNLWTTEGNKRIVIFYSPGRGPYPPSWNIRLDDEEAGEGYFASWGWESQEEAKAGALEVLLGGRRPKQRRRYAC